MEDKILAILNDASLSEKEQAQQIAKLIGCDPDELQGTIEGAKLTGSGVFCIPPQVQEEDRVCMWWNGFEWQIGHGDECKDLPYQL